jgi:tRNA (guanine-N7-)-methyltransferase
MRRKKNLSLRVERHAALLLGRLYYTGETDDPAYGDFTGLLDWRRIFGNGNPVYLEIGCGKGAFALRHARKHPHINLVAMEKCENVAVTALENAEALQEGGNGCDLANLRFIIGMAEFLPAIIPPGSLERIYLNFSCPFPKTSYAGRRLTSPRFLEVYERLLCPGGEIWQKTDNQPFYEYSRNRFNERGWQITAQTENLQHSHIFEPDGNIITEYESKFIGEGKPIYALRAARPLNESPNECNNKDC